MTHPGTRPVNIWWLHPAAIFGIAGPLIGVIAYALPESTYRTYWRTPKFFTLESLEITIACASVFIFGSILSSKWFGASDRKKTCYETRWPVPPLFETLFRFSFYLCLLGYVLWAALAISRGMTLATVLGVVTGEKGAMYDARFTYLPTVGGVTTLTQFGTAAMIFGAIVGCRMGWYRVRFKLCVMAGLALVRALVNSERFALIELGVPFLLAWLALRYLGSRDISRFRARLMDFAPLMGAAALFVLFTCFEYFRSWTNYYAGRDLNLLEFGAMRLFGYYVTSFNNGAYFLDRLDALHAPYFSLHFLWGFPLTSPVIQRLFTNPLLQSTDKWFYFPFLESEANIEFNNANGMFFPLMDYGVAGGLLYWLLMGVICGWLYESYRNRQLAGMLLYPATFLGLIESPLALYWGEGRSFPSLLLLAATPLLVWMWRRNAFDGGRLSATHRPLQPTL